MAARCLVTVLHVLTALAALGSSLSVMLGWVSSSSICQPPGIDNKTELKQAIKYSCEACTFGSSAICVVIIVMAITLNCCWNKWSCSFLNQLMTLLVCIASLGSAAALTVVFWLWCDILEGEATSSTGCMDAAKSYDGITSSNETTSAEVFFVEMAFQQSCQYTVAVIAALTIAAYTLVIKKQGSVSTTGRRGHHYFVPEDESTPLIYSRGEPVNRIERANSESLWQDNV